MLVFIRTPLFANNRNPCELIRRETARERREEKNEGEVYYKKMQESLTESNCRNTAMPSERLTGGS